MQTFAVIETGGKQYKVSADQRIRIEKLPVPEGEIVVFDKVLLTSGDGDIKIGTPYIDGKKINGKVLKQGRDRKKIVFKYHSKTRYRKKKGHRQHFTEVQIQSF